MKKILIGLVVLVAVLGVAVWQLYANLDVIVEKAIENIGTDVTRTAVAVDRVELQLLEGKAAVSGLDVANPPGFSSPTIFHLGKVALSIDIDSLKGGPIVIDELLVNEPQVFLEVNEENHSNLSVLKSNVESYKPTTTSPTGETETPAAEGEAVKFIIHKLVFEGGHVSVTSALAPDKPVATDLPAFQITDLGKARGGATGEQLAKEILDRLIQEAKQAAAKAGVDAAKKELQQKAQEKLEKKFGGALNGILGQ